MKTSISLTEEITERLEKASNQTSNSRSAIIRMAIFEYLRDRNLWETEEAV